jgi:two-component system phosphate regulon sensor histidine kinase PhoR
MFTFRQKILISNIIVVCIFLAIMFPLANKIVNSIIITSLEERASQLIIKIEEATDIRDMIKKLKKEKPQTFFRVSILDHNGGILYDTHAKRLLGAQFTPGYVAKHSEVEAALLYGVGYSEDYSHLLKQKLIYVAKRFSHEGNYFILRTAFPYKHVKLLANSVEIAFLSMAAIILLLFSAMTWFIINHFTNPIQDIIAVVKPYQESPNSVLPEIVLKNTSPKDEFSQLANTLNSLSQKVQRHIDHLNYERNEKQAILESLNEGVIAVDSEMTVTYINDMALQLLQVHSDEILDKNLSVIDKPHFNNLLIKCQKEQQLSTLTTTVGEKPRVYLEIIAAPKGKGAVLVLQDTSSHYRMLEMRKDFIANASHELKTPITIIQGFAETLHDNPGLPQETCTDILGRIVNNCRRMEIIVKNLLTLADIESLPRSRLKAFDIYDMVVECKEHVISVYKDAQVSITKNTDEMIIFADPDLMAVAVNNLINNAARYSDAPAEIIVNINRVSDEIQVSVSDTGLGIPKNELENIFQRFYTIVQGKRKKQLGSSGLGLSIVETIMNKHFGKVEVKSKVGEGTTFTLTLPIEDE